VVSCTMESGSGGFAGDGEGSAPTKCEGAGLQRQ
jgi:hypothetical protein